MTQSIPCSHAHPLLNLLVRRPGEYLEVLLRIAERRLDPLWARPPAYRPFGANEGRIALAGALAAAATVWDEPALHGIETQARARRVELGASGPWGNHYDADFALGRHLYVLCRALRPALVVETGVAYGLSSAFMLQALRENGHGELHSIDLPPLSEDANGSDDDYIGALIPAALKARWKLYRGSSRRLLRRVLAGRTLDLFVQDSSHTYWTVRRECAAAWHYLRPGGVLVSDDIECCQAFDELRSRHPAFWGCFRQEHKRALFGIAVK